MNTKIAGLVVVTFLLSLALLCTTPTNPAERPPELALAIDEYVFHQHTEIQPVLPAVANGVDVDAFSIKPELPQGLNFNSENGEISGIPSEIAAKKMYKIKGLNEFGSGSKELFITVVPAAPDSVSGIKSSDTSVVLSWADRDNIESFSIYRSTDSVQNFEHIATVRETSFTDSNINDSLVYYYLTAVSENIEPSMPSETIMVRLLIPNTLPVAGRDSFYCYEDNVLECGPDSGVIANDTDSDGDLLTAALDDSTHNGVLLFESSGAFKYTPEQNWFGADSFSYLLTDAQQGTAGPARVIIEVISSNDVPSSSPDEYAGTYGQLLSVNASQGVLANDSDVEDGTPSKAEEGIATVNGDLGLEETGAFTYMPDSGFSGVDSFTYYAVDSDSAASEITTVTIIVSALDNAPPVADDDSWLIDEDSSLALSIVDGPLANDSDPDSDALTLQLEDSTTYGDLQWDPDGSFNYTPPSNWSGTDSFTYVCSDGNGGVSDEAVVHLIVKPVNDMPVITDIPDQSIIKGTSFSIINLDNFVEDIDDADSTLTWTVAGLSDLSVTVDTGRHATISMPDQYWTGEEKAAFTVKDSSGDSAVDSVIFRASSGDFFPVVGDIPDQTIDEGAAFDPFFLDSFVTDNDDPLSALSWSYSGNVDLTVAIDANSHLATITIPDQDWFGGEVITFRAEDPQGNYTTNDATYTVININDAPVITSTAPQTATEHQEYSYVPSAVDAENGALTWTLTNAPSGMTVNAVNGAVSWTPGEGTSTSGAVTLTVTDEGNPQQSGSQEFTVTVTPVNDPPEITSTAPSNAVEHVEFTYAPSAVDPEGGTLTWGLENQPSGMTINSTTGAISWTPGEGVSGSGAVTLIVTDDGTPQLSDSQEFSLTVNQQNNPPEIASTPPPDAVEHIEYTYTPAATDPEGGVLTWSLTGAPAGMNLNPVSGRIAWTPGEGITTSGLIRLTATDDGTPAKSSTQEFTITVEAVNNSPTITSTPPSSATEHQEYTYEPTATDPENGTLTWSIDNQPGGMTINSTIGTISWTPGEGITSSGTITLAVTDDGTPPQADTQEISITVVAYNNPPEITSTAPTSATEDQQYTYAPSATDPESGTLTWSLSNQPGGMTINSTTGEIAWTPGEGVTSSGAVTLTVTDDGTPNQSDTETFTVSVTQVNDPPQITSTAPASATEHQQYSYTPSATDPESGTLTWGLSNQPNGMTINSSSGEITWTPGEGVTSSGTVTLTVTDDGTPNESDTEQFTISVTPVNDPPEVISTNPAHCGVANVYRTTLSASDPEGDSFTFSKKSGPSGLSVSSSGEVVWRPDWDYRIGSDYSVTVDINATTGPSGEYTWSITIDNHQWKKMGTVSIPVFSATVFGAKDSNYIFYGTDYMAQSVLISRNGGANFVPFYDMSSPDYLYGIVTSGNQVYLIGDDANCDFGYLVIDTSGSFISRNYPNNAIYRQYYDLQKPGFELRKSDNALFSIAHREDVACEMPPSDTSILFQNSTRLYTEGYAVDERGSRFRDVAIAQNNTNYIFFNSVDDNGAHFFTSSNGGSSWKQYTDDTYDGIILESDKNNADTLYLLGSGLRRCTAPWVVSPAKPQFVNVDNASALNPWALQVYSGSVAWILGTDGQLYTTQDGFETVIEEDGLTGGAYLILAEDRKTLYFVTSGGDIYR
ncbi:MAG: tandem-95 repeat protein [Chitinivibrionales bacterium]|nr:tandem-95 repeat protein [Chitinivibrionales bacterium]